MCSLRIPPPPAPSLCGSLPHSRALPRLSDPIKRANKRGDWVFTALCSQRGGRHSADAKNDATPAALGSQAGDAQLRRGPQLHCTRRADVRHSQLHCARRAFVRHPQLRRQRHSHRQRRRNATARCAILFREMCELARRTQSATNGKSCTAPLGHACEGPDRSVQQTGARRSSRNFRRCVARRRVWGAVGRRGV